MLFQGYIYICQIPGDQTLEHFLSPFKYFDKRTDKYRSLFRPVYIVSTPYSTYLN